ncbi:hypothetical protein QP920_10375 [Corynebacterium marquesiae]|nr:hypothetical protein [Corynebacterium marquesiae]MDK8496847.1 hypothetical protein [Corynebacterium marquesiae]
MNTIEVTHEYIARSTRTDGKNKGETLQDLRKAKYFIEREIERTATSD